MAEPVDTPIVVDPNAVPAQIASAMRVALILIGGLSAVLGFVQARDLVGLIAYFQSADFLPVIGAAVAIGSFLYGQWKLRMDKREKVILADNVPDPVGFVARPPER